MSRIGDACFICQSVLCSEDSPLVKKDRHNWGLVSAPEQTFEVFSKAARNGCVICSRLWNRNEECRRVWSDSQAATWKPIQYKAEARKPGLTLTNTLVVLYIDPLEGLSTMVQFCFVATNDDEYSSHFLPYDKGTRISVESRLRTADQWLSQCQATHLSCRLLSTLWTKSLPSRVIDIGRDNEIYWTLRVVGEDGISPASSYVTLSYRWGPKQRLMLLSSNITKLRQGSLIQNLPRTFRNAVTVARHFGVRYVWIDALCIMQDSTEDWEREAPKMRDVYANSVCNIAAAACSDPEEAMFKATEPEQILPHVLTTSLFDGKPSPYYVYENDYWDKQTDGPIQNRGWILQERFLAPRVLYFGQHQMLFECQEDHKCEGFPNGTPTHISRKNIDPLLDYLRLRQPENKHEFSIHVFNLWSELVTHYSNCDLTKPSDKMFAIAGIAKFFRDITDDQYLAGWWRSSLLHSLDWRVYEPRHLRDTLYRAPSWSWASTDSPLVARGISPTVKYLVKIVDVKVSTQGSDPFVNVIGGTLLLKCSFFGAQCHYRAPHDLVLRTEKGEIATFFYRDSLNIEFTEGKELICIPYKSDYSRDNDGDEQPVIMFHMAEEVRTCGEQVQFRRLGWFQLFDPEAEKFRRVRDSAEICLV